MFSVCLLSSCGPRGTCSQCEIEDVHNFSYTSRLDVATEVLAARTDGTVDWSDLRQDIRGRPVEPQVEPGEAVLLLFPLLSAGEVQQLIAADSMTQDVIGAYFICEPQTPSCALSEFCLEHTCLDPAEYFEASRGTWMVVLRDGSTQQALSFAFLEPDDSSDQSLAALDDSSALLQVQADLSGSDPLMVVGDPELELGWAGLTQDGLGNPLALHRLDLLELARFEGGSAELEAEFLLLDELDAERWTSDVEGQLSADLRDLDGAAFEGVDADGTWLLALRCSSCLNPVPKVIVRLVGPDDGG